MKQVLFGFSILTVLFFMHILFMGTRRRRSSFAPLLRHPYAHRGLYNEEIPENSLTAFRLAVEKGVGIELDVRLSADGEVMVFHDESLKRMTGVDKPFHTLTRKELGELRLGESDERIPTLREVLALVGGKVPLLVEIKPGHGTIALCRKASALLDEYQGAYMIESFHPFAVRWFRKHRPKVMRGQLSMRFSPKEKGYYALFVVQNLLLNFLALPDFVAYNYRHKNFYAFSLCRFFYHPYTLAWTVKDEEGLKKSGSFDNIIFEGLDVDLLSAAGRLPALSAEDEESL